MRVTSFYHLLVEELEIPLHTGTVYLFSPPSLDLEDYLTKTCIRTKTGICHVIK
jgi:hypothetical protein